MMLTILMEYTRDCGTQIDKSFADCGKTEIRKIYMEGQRDGEGETEKEAQQWEDRDRGGGTEMETNRL